VPFSGGIMLTTLEIFNTLFEDEMSQYLPPNKRWNHCKQIGDQGEIAFQNEFQTRGNLTGPIHVNHFRNQGLDYDWDFELDGETYEVKTLTGDHEYAVVEVWCDRNRTTRPSWWKASRLDLLDYYVIYRKEQKKLYIYNAKTLYENRYKLFNSGEMTASNGGTGFIRQIKWLNIALIKVID